MVYAGAMDAQEYEMALQDFEDLVRKRLPAMINISLANKGNREQEAAFRHFLETLQRKRKVLLRDLSRMRSAQRVRYHNAIYFMDSQLRSMNQRQERQQRLKLRRHTVRTPLVYDLGGGPEDGELLNVLDDGLLLKTSGKVDMDKDMVVGLGEKTARCKAMWSLPDEKGGMETGVRLLSPSHELMDEIRKCLEDLDDNS